MMNRFRRATLCGISDAVPVGFLVVVSGGIMGGLDGIVCGAFLCPLLSVPVWMCGFVVSLTTDKD